MPALLISPYARQNYVSHTLYEFSSFLTFIENQFGIPALTSRDSGASSFGEEFDFTQPPRQALVLDANSPPQWTLATTTTRQTTSSTLQVPEMATSFLILIATTIAIGVATMVIASSKRTVK